jgi:hypothetical protein
MGKALIVLLAYLTLGVLEIVPLIRKKEKKNIAVYLIFWTLAAVFSLLLVLKVKLPSFERTMIEIITSITQGGGM